MNRNALIAAVVIGAAVLYLLYVFLRVDAPELVDEEGETAATEAAEGEAAEGAD